MRRDISRAIKTLAAAGVQIDKDKVAAAMRGNTPAIKHKDLRKFRQWCATAWAQDARFIVGYTRDRSLVFHSEAGLKKLQSVAEHARSMKNGAEVPSGSN